MRDALSHPKNQACAENHMSDITTSSRLKTNYQDYYKDGHSQWRRLGAIGKVDNIVALCARLRHSSMLEVGAGECSILQRLSELRFGEELYALEISPIGIEAIKRQGIAQLVECSMFDGYRITPEDVQRWSVEEYY